MLIYRDLALETARMSGVDQLAAVDALSQRISDSLDPHGFECHPFLVGWYNSQGRSEIMTTIVVYFKSC